MSTVITPNPEIFSRSAPTLVVFGAYRQLSDQEPPNHAAAAQIADAVRVARSYRMEIAYCRPRIAERKEHVGLWAHGCRPKVHDMVFDFEPPSCFTASEMHHALNLRATKSLLFVGPDDDSHLERSIVEAQELFVSVLRITSAAAMQKSSARLEHSFVDPEIVCKPAAQPAAGRHGLLSHLRSVQNLK